MNRGVFYGAVIVLFIGMLVLIEFGDYVAKLQPAGGSGGGGSGGPFGLGYTEGDLNSCPPNKVYECKRKNTRDKSVRVYAEWLGLSGGSRAGLNALINSYQETENEFNDWLKNKQCPNNACSKSEHKSIAIKGGFNKVGGSCSSNNKKTERVYVLEHGRDADEALKKAKDTLVTRITNYLHENRNYCPSGCSLDVKVIIDSIRDSGREPTDPSTGQPWAEGPWAEIKALIHLSCTGAGSSGAEMIAWLEAEYCIDCSPRGGTTSGGTQNNQDSDQQTSTGSTQNPDSYLGEE